MTCASLPPPPWRNATTARAMSTPPRTDHAGRSDGDHHMVDTDSIATDGRGPLTPIPGATHNAVPPVSQPPEPAQRVPQTPDDGASDAREHGVVELAVETTGCTAPSERTAPTPGPMAADTTAPAAHDTAAEPQHSPTSPHSSAQSGCGPDSPTDTWATAQSPSRSPATSPEPAHDTGASSSRSTPERGAVPPSPITSASSNPHSRWHRRHTHPNSLSTSHYTSRSASPDTSDDNDSTTDIRDAI